MNSKFQEELLAMDQDDELFLPFNITSTNTPGQYETIIFGAENTIYQGAAYKVMIEVPPKYPYEKPKIYFSGVIPYHPNVSPISGEICIALLKGEWTETSSVNQALHCINYLLTDPNPISYLNKDAADIYLKNIEEYNKLVKANVLKSANQNF